MLKLNQHESNVLYWSKGRYGGKQSEVFWPQLKILCDKGYLMTCDVEDMYSIVRILWVKILDVLPNKNHLWDEYENDTLPHKARYYWGAPNYGNRDWHCKDSFNAEQLLKARTAKMISQIGSTKVKYYESMMPEDIGDLKIENREKLMEMFERKNVIDSAE